MFLLPSEVGFLKHLKEARVPLVEFELPANKILNIQSQLEMLIGKNYYLNKVGHPSPYDGASIPRLSICFCKVTCRMTTG